MKTVCALPVPRDIASNLRWRRRALYDGAKRSGAAAAFKRQCANDILFYINTFCFTYDPRKDSKVLPFITYPFQDKAILQLVDDIEVGRDVGIMKSRDMGASWIILTVLEWMWQFKGMNSFLVVSRNEDYVDAPADPKSLFWKIDFLLKHQPGWLRPNVIDRKAMHIGNGENGSVIDGESTTGEVGRGDRRTAIMMDEFAAFDVKSGYNALASTQSATKCRIFNSTPKGCGNAFYDVVHKSSADIIRMHWSEHPEKAMGLYTTQRDPFTGRLIRKLLDGFRGIVEVSNKGERKVKQVAFPEDYPFILDGKVRSPWYDRECSRAVTQQEIGQELDIDFLGSDYQFFDQTAVSKYIQEICREPNATGDFTVSGGGVISFTPHPHGMASLFEMPKESGRYDPDRKFVMGVDVSAGTGASNSTFAIYDKATREKVAEYANPRILPDDFGRLVVGVARLFNDAHIVPDRSGPTGEVLVARIFNEGYTNVYRRKNAKKLGTPVTNEPGVWLNPTARTAILQQYRDAIGHTALINRSERAMKECLSFICKMDGTIEHVASANAKDPGGARSNHGDLVIADALVSLAIGDSADYERAKDVELPAGSLAYRMKEERMAQISAAAQNELGKEWAI